MIKVRISDRVGKQVLRDKGWDCISNQVENLLYIQIHDNMLPWPQGLRELDWAVDHKLEQDIGEIRAD
jgi:hypothetical protein